MLWADHSWKCARELCELGLSLPDKSKYLKDGLIGGAVIFYTRLFTENDGLGSIKADKIFEDFSDNPICGETHETVLELRNKLIAHKSELWDKEKTEGLGKKKTYNLRLERPENDQSSLNYFTSMSGICVEGFEITAELILELLEYQKAKASKVTDQIMVDLEVGVLEPGDYEIIDSFLRC